MDAGAVGGAGEIGAGLSDWVVSLKRLFDLFRGQPLTLLGLGERCATALNDLKADIVKPYLIGPGAFIDDAGHAAHAYGQDALILIRPDGYSA